MHYYHLLFDINTFFLLFLSFNKKIIITASTCLFHTGEGKQARRGFTDLHKIRCVEALLDIVSRLLDSFSCTHTPKNQVRVMEKHSSAGGVEDGDSGVSGYDYSYELNQALEHLQSCEKESSQDGNSSVCSPNQTPDDSNASDDADFLQLLKAALDNLTAASSAGPAGWGTLFQTPTLEGV